jgi:ABC-type enterochelin transport system ATPase subunit
MAELNKLNVAFSIILIAGLALGWIGSKSIDKLFDDTDNNTKSILVQRGQIESILSTQAEVKSTMSIMISELRKVSDGQIRLNENFKQFEVVSK